jgi:hypothetical protein
MPLVLTHKARKPKWQDTRPPEKELRDAYAIAAANETAFSRAFLRFTRDLMSPAIMRDIARAVRSDRVEAAVNALPVLEASDILRERFERAYLKIVQEAGQDEINRQKWRFQFEVIEKRIEARFGGPVPINPFSILWIKQQAAKRVREITDAQQDNVRNVVLRGFSQGLRGPVITQQIEQEVGLLEREQKAVERRYQSALAQGVQPEKADRDRAKYATSLLRKRGQRIARTETIDAQAQGRNDAWALAKEQGMVPAGTKREWVAATESDRTCPICLELDGQQVDLGEPYDSAVLGIAIQRPTAHPGCRCVEILVFPGG